MSHNGSPYLQQKLRYATSSRPCITIAPTLPLSNWMTRYLNKQTVTSLLFRICNSGLPCPCKVRTTATSITYSSYGPPKKLEP